MSGKVPARKMKQTPYRSIYILPLNVGDRDVAKFNASALGMLKRQEHAQNVKGYRLMTSKLVFSPEESKSKILRDYCKGRLINNY